MSTDNIKLTPDQKIPKKIVSEILCSNRRWIDARISKPDPGQQVVIRITDPTMIAIETDTEIMPMEDEKIAEFITGPNGVGGEWHVCPPFPKYDYSPLSQKDQINEGVVVTHWAEPADGEIEGWNTRFDQINIFQKLILEVDAEHEADVYRALMWGAAFIQKANPGDPMAQRLATILYDLQYCIDKGVGVNLSDEEYEKLIDEKMRAEALGKEEALDDENPYNNEPEDKAEEE